MQQYNHGQIYNCIDINVLIQGYTGFREGAFQGNRCTLDERQISGDMPYRGIEGNGEIGAGEQIGNHRVHIRPILGGAVVCELPYNQASELVEDSGKPEVHQHSLDTIYGFANVFNNKN